MIIYRHSRQVLFRAYGVALNYEGGLRNIPNAMKKVIFLENN